MLRAGLVALLASSSLAAVTTPVVGFEDPRVVFTPDSAWSPGLQPGKGGRSTTTRGASVSFTGAIQGLRLFGAVRRDGADFTASIDGGPTQTFSAAAANATANVGLVDYSRLDIDAAPRNHTVVFTHADSRANRTFEWDHIRITLNDSLASPSRSVVAAPPDASITASDMVAADTTIPRLSENVGPPATKESPVTIAGSVVGALAIAGLIVGLAFRYRRQIAARLPFFRRQRGIDDDDRSFYAVEKASPSSGVGFDESEVPSVPPLTAFLSPASRTPSMSLGRPAAPLPDLSRSPPRSSPGSSPPTQPAIAGFGVSRPRISAISESTAEGSQYDERRGTLQPTRQVW